MTDQNVIDRVNIFNFPPLSLKDIENLKNKLKVCFSHEFMEIAKIADFEYFNCFNINNLNLENESSVIGDTLRLRKNNHLPNDTLFLCEDDASVLLMRCLGDHEEIFWLAVEDFENFCKDEALEYPYNLFSTFTDFFKYLLDEEEKEITV